MAWPRNVSICVTAFVIAGATAAGEEPGRPAVMKRQLLWPDGAPLAQGTGDEDRPSLEAFPPPPATTAGRGGATAVIVCPGGGYGRLAVEKEGIAAARWLNERGAAAFILRYRVGPRYHHPAPLLDILRAVRTVRAQARALGLAPDRIGVWGFSAGGHLASMAATLFDEGDPKARDPIDRQSARPDFAILGYPVIFMTADKAAHGGSRHMLLGDDPPAELGEQLSTDRRVTSRTPPTFLFHTNEDHSVPAENSVAFYLALRHAGVPAELHVYETGGHGVGLHPDDAVLATWTDRLADWMRRRKLLAP
jgi:acetyl esterase/lipase